MAYIDDLGRGDCEGKIRDLTQRVDSLETYGNNALAIIAAGAVPGPAATIAVQSTTTGAPGTSASVLNTGTSSAALLSFTIPQGANGATGGNIMSIPSFATVRAAGAGATPTVIPSGASIVMTAFHTTAKYGRAFYELRTDINDAYLASYPRSSFKAVNEIGTVTRWALYAGKEWEYEAFGAVPYTGALNSATAANDCSPAFDEMQALNAASPAIGNIFFSFSGRKVSVGPGRFYHTRPHNLHARWDFVGAGGGAAGAVNTALVFAADIYGVIVNRYNTDGDQVVTGFSVNRADASSYRMLGILSLGGTDRTKHGVWMRARATLEDVYISGFPGNNVNIVANSSADTTLGTNVSAGNANDWQMTRVSSASSGQHAYYVAGIDANAGHAVGCEVLSAGCGGIMDVSFLGNKWTACAVHTTNTRGLGRVNYGGKVYDLINRTDGIGGTTTPGTNAAVWYQTGTTAGADSWVSGNEYIVSNCVFSDNPNARSIFDDQYVEGGTCIGHIAPPSLVLGGQNDTKYTYNTPWFISQGGEGGPLVSTTGNGGYFNPPAFHPAFATHGSLILSVTGYNMFDTAVNPRVWRFKSSLSDDFTCVLLPNNDGYQWQAASGPRFSLNVGRSNALTLGRSSPAVRNTAAGNSNGVFHAFDSGISLLANNNGRKIQQVLTTPPTGQDYAAGEFAFTNASLAQRCIGFSCVTSAVVTAPVATSTVLTSEAVWYKAGALFIDATVVYDPASLAPGAADAEQTVTVTGAALGDNVVMTYPGDSKGLACNARVSAANTVKFFMTNPGGNPNGTVDLASATFKIRVEKM